MKKILIVEDDAILLSTLADNFSHAGFEIIKAKDGEEGFASALSEKPDLILLDILLPKMDGIAVLKKLRQEDWGKDIPVIILTNLNSPANVSEALEDMGELKEYLVKSDLKIKDLIARVKERLK